MKFNKKKSDEFYFIFKTDEFTQLETQRWH